MIIAMKTGFQRATRRRASSRCSLVEEAAAIAAIAAAVHKVRRFMG
jgi:hypothetical protein